MDSLGAGWSKAACIDVTWEFPKLGAMAPCVRKLPNHSIEWVGWPLSAPRPTASHGDVISIPGAESEIMEVGVKVSN